MALYDVVKPCMVGKLHYARPTTQPVEVDDATAGPLVKTGNLTPVGIEGRTGDVVDGIARQVAFAGQQAGQEFTEGVTDEERKPEPEHRTRRPRGTAG